MQTEKASPVEGTVRQSGDPCLCGEEKFWHAECYTDKEAAQRRGWLRMLQAPEYTYDWDEHPDGYDGPCCCESCRYYAAQDG